MSYWINITVALISFALAAVIGIVLIPFLKKIHFGQTILDIGPAWHKSKQGTPITVSYTHLDVYKRQS